MLSPGKIQLSFLIFPHNLKIGWTIKKNPQSFFPEGGHFEWPVPEQIFTRHSTRIASLHLQVLRSLVTISWAEYNWRSLKSQPVFREVNKTWPIPWRQKEATVQRQLKCQQDLEKASQPPQNKVLSLGRSWAAEDRRALQRIQGKVLEPQNSVLMSWKGNRNNPERFPSLERFCLSFFARVGAKFEFAF